MGLLEALQQSIIQEVDLVDNDDNNCNILVDNDSDDDNSNNSLVQSIAGGWLTSRIGSNRVLPCYPVFQIVSNNSKTLIFQVKYFRVYNGMNYEPY